MKTQKTSEKEPFYDLSIWKTVAFLMKKNRWDVKYMAEKVGVTPATFRRWLKRYKSMISFGRRGCKNRLGAENYNFYCFIL